MTQIWRLGQAAIMQCLYNKLMRLVDAHVAYNTIVYLVKDSLGLCGLVSMQFPGG